jgi:uncharacterized protein YndB with AHSA1/START domain
MTERSVQHATFVIERTYPAQPARVFAAWASQEAKKAWMNEPDHPSDDTGREFDFRVGGRERFDGMAPDGTNYRYDALYFDIVPDQRIVYAYEMYAGPDRISVSVATVQIEPADGGTALTYTEQGAFLDGLDQPEARQEGTEWLLGNLGKHLAGQAAS